MQKNMFLLYYIRFVIIYVCLFFTLWTALGKITCYTTSKKNWNSCFAKNLPPEKEIIWHVAMDARIQMIALKKNKNPEW